MGLGPELSLEPKIARALRACVAAPPASSPGMCLQVATWSRTAALCLRRDEGGSGGWGVLTGRPAAVARWLGEDATESLAMGTEVRRVAAATLRHGAELAAAREGDLALSMPMGACSTGCSPCGPCCCPCQSRQGGRASTAPAA